MLDHLKKCKSKQKYTRVCGLCLVRVWFVSVWFLCVGEVSVLGVSVVQQLD